jgi:flavin-binding protein dodecin
MPEHVYRITEIVGSLARQRRRRHSHRCETAAKTLHHLDWFEVTEIRGHFTDETIGHFHVTMRVGFRLDDDVE